MMGISFAWGNRPGNQGNFTAKFLMLKKSNRYQYDTDYPDCDVAHQSLFACLTPAELQLFDEHKSCLVFKKGQHIFNEGNYPLGVYCIDTGKVKLEHSGDEGKMQIVRMAKAGNIVGYRALFCNEKYNASAVAIEDTNICFVPKDVFNKVLESNNQLAHNFIKLLASDLRKAEDHLTELAQNPVRERMAKALLFLKETYGLEEDEATINVTLTREELADLVGTATETAIRLLSELRHDGIVEFVGKKIRISSLPRLVKAAHAYQPEYHLY
jgi:CRP/FNR family transcriptional regulator, polysaccharide utilization system transcription regulator